MTVSAPHRVAHTIFSTSSLDRGGDRGVADVGVDLDQEVPADDHRLGLGVVDVGRDHRAAGGDLVAHELGADALAQRDELHLGGDQAPSGIGELRHGAGPLDPAHRLAAAGEHGVQVAQVGGLQPVVGRLPGPALVLLGVAALGDPRRAQRRQAEADVGAHLGVGVGAGGVVEDDGVAVGQRDLAHRHAQVRTRGGGQVRLARSGVRGVRGVLRVRGGTGGFRRCGHVIHSRHGGAPYVGITRTGSAVDGASRPLSPVRPSSRVYVVSVRSVARVP